MKFLKQLFHFYITSSIHVALSVYSLVRMTYFMFDIPANEAMANFAFFGTIVGYNFVKYDALARAKRNQMRKELKLIALLSFFSLVGVGYSFFQLERITQLVAVAVLALTLLYTLPFFPNRKNARNWAGVKIYIVSLCWVGVTLVLPLINAHFDLGIDFYLKCVQRFILIFVLILIFEIIDLANDDPHLQTVPQQIGVERTKNLGYVLLLFFCGLEFLMSNINVKGNFQFIPLQILLIFVIAILVALFLLFANEKRSKYYTSFWVESIPILWWLLVAFL
ncbi:MAG: hypothetical protein V4497_11915 [Bacteroidota bacterium]